MRATRLLTCMLAAAFCSLLACAQQPEPAQKLVHEVVYNELHDHDQHGLWRYWIKQRVQDGSHLSEQVETNDGPVARVVLINGQPLDEQNRQAEQARLGEFLNSPSQQASHRQAYAEDEKRVARILALLPDAFCFEDLGTAGVTRHLRFHPNPEYSAHTDTIESKVFHAMSGDLWIDTRMKRLAKLEGRMENNLDFGFGILGRINKGSWFLMQRTQVSPTEWKTSRLEVHMSGRAVFFKTIARETSEVRCGFTRVPAGMSLTEAARMLEHPNLPTAEVSAQLTPASYTGSR